MPGENHQPYFNLMDAFKEPGCPICSLVQENIHKFMDILLYEQVNDPGVRNEIRISLGFCSLHAWQLQKLGDPFGSAIIYEDLMKNLVDRMDRMVISEKSVKNLFAEILKIKNKGDGRKKAICPICKSGKGAETRYVSTFIESFNEPDFFSAYSKSFGLCFPHIVEIFNICRQNEILREILNIESAKMKDLIGELKEIQRKNDYRFSQEGFGKEGNAWIRAIEKMTGKEGVTRDRY